MYIQGVGKDIIYTSKYENKTEQQDTKSQKWHLYLKDFILCRVINFL
jgi:hypothetical protein